MLYGHDRTEAIARLQRALEEFAVRGIKTNAGLFRSILRDPEFVRGEIFTRWLDERLASLVASGEDSETGDSVEQDAAIVAAWLHHFSAGSPEVNTPANGESESRWKTEARREQVSRNLT